MSDVFQMYILQYLQAINTCSVIALAIKLVF